MWVDLCHEERGRGHIAADIPCQDKTYAIEKDGVSVIALSDGAGSAKLSHFGAEKITEKIARYLVENFETIYRNEDANAVREEIVKEANETAIGLAEELSCEKKDLACTLLAVAVKDDRYILMHCGDGIIGFMRGDELKVATEPMNGEFANETVFITSHNSVQCLRLAKGNLNGIRAFVLMSDGPVCLYGKREVSFADLPGKWEFYFARAVAKMIDQATFMPMESMRETVMNAFRNTVIKKTFDDCSIAFLVKRDGETSKYGQLSFEEKCELLLVNGVARNSKYVLAKTENMFRILQHPATIGELSDALGTKSIGYLEKKLHKFIKAGAITNDDGFYRSSINL